MLFSVRPGIFLMLLISCAFISCDKDSNETQGTNFNVLLKTVTKNHVTNLGSTANFTYNSSNQLTRTEFLYSNPQGTQETTETFYRNNTGRLDSSLYISTGSGTTYITKTFLSYDASGKITKSIQVSNINQTIDSSLYVYSGNILQQRNDYRSIGGGAFFLLRRGFYTFDVSGNLTQAIFQWPQSNIIDTARFEYDNKINPMPLDRLIFYWAPFFYNDYKPLNNPTLLSTDAAESYNNEYTYTTNDKPLYRRSKVIGSTNSFSETWYYYD